MNPASLPGHPDAHRWRTAVLEYLRPRVWQAAAAERLAAQTVDQAIREARRRGKSAEDDAAFRLELLRLAHANLRKYAATLKDVKAAAWINACLQADRMYDLAPAKPKTAGRKAMAWLAVGATALAVLLAVMAYQQFGGDRKSLIEVASKPTKDVVSVVKPEEEKPAPEKMTPAPTEKEAVVPPPEEPKREPVAEVKPAPVEPPPVPKPMPMVVPPPMKPEPPPVPAAIAQNLVPEAGWDKMLKFDDPQGEVVVPDLKRKRWKLSGRAKRLVLGTVDEHSTVDAAGLTAKEIVFTKKVEADSTVHVSAPQGIVEVRDKIYDGSKLTIDAPEGKIDLLGRIDADSTLVVNAPRGAVSLFGKIYDTANVTINAPQGNVRLMADNKAKIADDSKVSIIAQVCDVDMPVHGDATKVFVTLTGAGQLKFRELKGNASLHYRKQNASDPEPTIAAGRVLNGADFRLAP